MMSLGSTELDDAIFPQPPNDETANDHHRDIIRKQEDCAGRSRPTSKETRERFGGSFEDLSLEQKDGMIDNEDEMKSSKKKTFKKPSRIKRLFTGIRLKKESASSSDEDQIEKENESNLELDPHQDSVSEDLGLTNRTAITRIIQRVQFKANRMWENLGQKLGGRTEDGELQDDTSREDDVNQIELTQEDHVDEMAGDKNSADCDKKYLEDSKISLSDLTNDENSGKGDPRPPHGKSGTLRRIASGLKSGLLPKTVKNKN